jgi:hypothetical protein
MSHEELEKLTTWDK